MTHRPTSADAAHPPLAIVGVSALFPGSTEAGGFWRDILAGRDLVSEVPESHWLAEDYFDPNPAAPDKTYCKRGGFLSPVPFDPMEFGLPPATVPATDSSQLLALIVAKQVLEDAAQGQFAQQDRSRMSVILGVTSGQQLFLQMASRLQRPIWVKALRESGLPEDEVQAACDRIADHYQPWQESTFPGLLGNVVAGRIANRFDLGGTNCVTDAACASSLSALAMAANELYLGQSDVVITGGVDVFNDVAMYMCFSKTPALSPTQDCRPFSDQADGTIMGEGLAMLAVKRLADAERDGDAIYAVVKGLGTSSDGRALSVYAPRSGGQAQALRRAYDAAGYGPDTVELVEAHGTGTKAGDAAEFAGLVEAFSEAGRPDPQWCALGSVKSQIGHTKAAAGAAGLFKVVMALHHRVLPPTIKVDRPNPKLALSESPFYLNTASRPWVRGAGHPRRASMSSFGFGGSNFHVTLEEYAGAGKRADRTNTRPSELVVLGAATPDALVARARELAAQAVEPGLLAHLAREAQRAHDPAAPARLAIVATDEADLVAKLKQAADAIARAPETALSLPTGVHYALGRSPGKVAFLFPGQGSQYVGMGADLAIHLDAARSAWDLAADVPMGEGEALQHVVFPRPAFDDATRAAQTARLTATEWAQPALGAASLALLGVLASLGVRPDALAGHSFGEIMALHAAGALSAADALAVARRRGELMAEAASTVPGAMAAVAHPAADLRALIAAEGLEVVLANHNGPRQSVISGATDAIARAESVLTAKGLSAKRLSVATAFHSPLVAGSTAPFGEFLAGVPVAPVARPVYANAEAAPYPADADGARALLASQIARPVRFVEMIEAMAASGVTTFIEVGPGAVLTGLVSDILAERGAIAVSLDRRSQHGVTALFNGLAQLAVAGLSLDFGALWAGLKAPVDPRTVKKPAFTMPITGAPYAKPYPPVGGAAALPAPNGPRQPEIREVVQEVVREVVREVPVPVPTAAPGAPAAPSGAGMDAYAVFQQALTQSHLAFQTAMTQSHEQFMTAMAGTIAQPVAAPVAMPHAVYAPHPAPMPLPVPATAAPAAAAIAPVAPAPVPAPAAAAPVPVAPAAPAATPALDLKALVLAVVSEKTGYPVEMLGLEMALEADLGIDSIKRVEILSAVQERTPGLPALDPAEMAATRTLGEIVGFLDCIVPAAPVAASGVAPVTPAVTSAIASVPAADIRPLMLTIVAEKTGYPVAMLDAGMALEADLGIDSIKRVEILSALQERVSGLPALDPGAMASLRTLGEIADHVDAQRPAASVGAPASAPVSAPAPATPRVDLKALVLSVVAEKTGYPVEMLAMDMALEADLGIDSIKRVEILSAVQERTPGMVAPDPTEMAATRTLGEIVAFLDRPAAGAPAPAPAVAAPAGPDLQALMLAVVAEKTGYPAAMLTLDMALEADLGIDSIKRVEILSAVQERTPGLPALDPGAMAALRTVGEIAAYLSEASGGTPAEMRAAVPRSAPAPLGRAVLRAVATSPVGHGTLPAPELGGIVLTEDGRGIAQALASILKGRGYDVRVEASVPADAGSVVFLGGLRAFTSDDEALAVNQEAFAAAQAIAQRLTVQGGAFVTVQDTGGDFGLSGVEGHGVWAAGLSGLAKTAALEWPKASVKAIDLQTAGLAPNALAARLADELLAGGPEREVGLTASGERLTLRSEGQSVPAGPFTLGPTDVVVASGGARGVTAATLIALAEAFQPKLVLLGRTPLSPEDAATRGARDQAGLKQALMQLAIARGEKPVPAEIGAQVTAILANREVEATLASLKAAGSEARYVAVDVRDAQAIADALAPIRAQWGPVTGLVHGAGVLADKAIADKTPAQFERVFETKVGGLRALLAATQADPLRAIALFSSVAARMGNPGQSDYAMANEILNKLAASEARRRGTDCVVKSLGWGPWDGGMVTPALKQHFERQGVRLLPVADGARMLVDELRSGPGGDTEVVLGGELPRPVGPLPALHLHVDATTHPYLTDHRVKDAPVLPAMLALEWCWRAAEAARPGQAVAEIRDLRVLRGATLDGFDAEGDRFVVRAEEGPDGALALSIEGIDGKVHYSATAVFGEPPRSAACPSPAIAPSPWPDAVLYDELLFHGPAFRVLRGLDGLGPDGAAARLVGSSEAGWPGGGWKLDPAALDGGLQLALVWGCQVLGKPSLPMGVASFRRHVAGPLEGSLRCVLRGAAPSAHRTASDLWFVDANGRVLAELHGVEMVLRPDAEPVAAR